jgi:hypothetical protein
MASWLDVMSVRKTRAKRGIQGQMLHGIIYATIGIFPFDFDVISSKKLYNIGHWPFRQVLYSASQDQHTSLLVRSISDEEKNLLKRLKISQCKT